MKKYLKHCTLRKITPLAEIDVFEPSAPLLAVYSLVPGVLEQCSTVIEQVIQKHPRDDVSVQIYVRGENDAKADHACVSKLIINA